MPCWWPALVCWAGAAARAAPKLKKNRPRPVFLFCVAPPGDDLVEVSAGLSLTDSDVCLNFSTRRALYDLAISLLNDAAWKWRDG